MRKIPVIELRFVLLQEKFGIVRKNWLKRNKNTYLKVLKKSWNLNLTAHDASKKHSQSDG